MIQGTIKKLLTGAKMAYERKGLSFLLRSGIKILTQYPFYKNFKPKRTFTLGGNVYTYFIHYYNLTWENERAVEIPIARKIVSDCKGKRILEVGNVLANYFPFDHDILDKYEVAPHVINEDVCDFKPPHPYDLIISISTMEHVGWDETPREIGKILRAVSNLKTMLAPRGKIAITVPLGYNSDLDHILRNKELPFTKAYYLKKISADAWAEVGWDEISQAQYDYKLRTATAIVLGIIEN